MSFSEWMLLVSGCLIISISPGPGALISMRQGIRFGPIFALYTILGLQIGIVLQLTIIFFGVGALIISSPLLSTIIIMLGALYLGIIGGVQIWRAKQHALMINSTHQVKSKDPIKALFNGIVIDSTNIKGMVLFLALFSQFISSQTSLYEYSIMAVTIVIIDTVIMLCYAFFAAKMRMFLQSVKHMQVFNIFTGCLFILLALLLLIH